MSDGIPPFPPLLMKYRQSEIGSFFFNSVLDTQNVVYIKNVQTKLLEVKKSESRLFFCWEWDEMSRKCRYLAQNDQKCILDQIWPFWGQIS